MTNDIQTGNVTIPLVTGLTLDGVKVKELTMREPLVDDQMNVQGPGSEAEKEVALIANLCMVTPKDIRSLTMRDYGRVKAKFLGFLD